MTTTRVVYILGAGRSGSTILGLLLGSVPGLAYLGEVDAWTRRKGVPNFGGSERRAFWSGVLEEAGPGARELFGPESWEQVESTRSLLSLRRSRGRALRARYRTVSAEVLRLASERSGADWVVDSSHYPLRLRELQQEPSLDVRVLYLFRDPRDVVQSFRVGDPDQGNKSRLAANAYLWLTTAVSAHVFSRTPQDRRTFVAYEELVRDPQQVIGRALDELGVDAGPVGPIGTLRPGVAFQGNRLLRQDAVEFVPSIRPPASDPVTRLLQLPWVLLVRRWRDR